MTFLLVMTWRIGDNIAQNLCNNFCLLSVSMCESALRSYQACNSELKIKALIRFVPCAAKDCFSLLAVIMRRRILYSHSFDYLKIAHPHEVFLFCSSRKRFPC